MEFFGKKYDQSMPSLVQTNFQSKILNYIHVLALIPLWPPYSSEHASFVQMYWKTSFPDLPLTTKVVVLSVFTLPLVLINLG